MFAVGDWEKGLLWDLRKQKCFEEIGQEEGCEGRNIC
jgi:hypothetical protein